MNTPLQSAGLKNIREVMMSKKGNKKRVNSQHQREAKRAALNKAIADDFSRGQQNLKRMKDNLAFFRSK